jgi:putative ABC transport system permease protein
MKGIFQLAFKLLVNDCAKFTALLVGITFAVFLMIEMTSLFAGILDKASSSVTNIVAKVWVMDPAVQTIANSIGMPGYVLDAVRSIDGVKYAVPLYSGASLVKLRDGTASITKRRSRIFRMWRSACRMGRGSVNA